MLQNPLCSFWQDDLSKVWAGTHVKKAQVDKPKPGQVEMFPEIAPRVHQVTKGWLADDPEMKAIYPITPEIARQSVPIKEHTFQNSGYTIMEHKQTRLRWVKQIY